MPEPSVKLHTIGFTKTSAEHFFGRLRTAHVARIVDIRLNNSSQLAGFAKSRDLAWFARELVGTAYVHEPLLAPTADILDAYKKRRGDWVDYRVRFLDLMEQRKIDQRYSPDFFENGCLLCSEDKPHRCHRSLVAEFLNDRWSGIFDIRHL